MKNQSPVNLPSHTQYFKISRKSIIQLKNQRFANKKAELMKLISKEKPDVVCIQERMLSNQANFNLKYYNGLSEHIEE